MGTRRVAFVVQRYGPEVIGGSESLCRSVAERLSPFYDVEVLTTCALDYHDWKNHFPEGTSLLNGVSVRRFRVEGYRRHLAMARVQRQVFRNSHSLPAERRWLDCQGPLAPDLLSYLDAARDRYAAVVFYTYLYAPTVDGLTLAPERSVLVPTAHDEPPLYLAIYRPVFHLPRRILYNTEAERVLVHRVFENSHVPHRVVGSGVEIAPREDSEYGDTFLYLGRVDPQKGVRELADWFLAGAAASTRGKEQTGPAFSLTIAGTLLQKLPRHPRLRVLGEVSESQKLELLRTCRAVMVPSLYESLSLTALEAWAHGKPVLARRGSPVLEEHLRRSGGGLLFTDAESLREAVGQVAASRDVARRMGEGGRDYVSKEYGWDRVIQAYRESIEAVSGETDRT